jgi:hypothetical protein
MAQITFLFFGSGGCINNTLQKWLMIGLFLPEVGDWLLAFS